MIGWRLGLLVLLICASPGVVSAQLHWEADLTWDDLSTDELGFIVEKKVGSGSFTVLTTTALNIETFRDIGPLSEGVEVCYRMYAFNAAGNSGVIPSAAGTCATPAVEPPIPPPQQAGMGRARIRY